MNHRNSYCIFTILGGVFLQCRNKKEKKGGERTEGGGERSRRGRFQGDSIESEILLDTFPASHPQYCSFMALVARFRSCARAREQQQAGARSSAGAQLTGGSVRAPGGGVCGWHPAFKVIGLLIAQRRATWRHATTCCHIAAIRELRRGCSRSCDMNTAASASARASSARVRCLGKKGGGEFALSFYKNSCLSYSSVRPPLHSVRASAS
jgi:hypothetical protein